MVVDIGGGTTEIALISLNGVVYSESVRTGGDRFDEAIVAFVRKEYGSLIGESTAERIKHEIGTAYPGGEILEIDVRGRNLAEGVPRQFTLNSEEILEALKDPLSVIVNAVKKSGQAKPSPKPSPKAPAAKAPSNPAAEPPSNPYAKPRGPGDSSKRRRTDDGGALQPAI